MLQTELQSVLTHIAQYGTLVQQLLAFIDTTVQAPPGVSQTYQAFAAALSGYMQDLSRDVGELERKVSKQGR